VQAIWINNDPNLGGAEISDTLKTLQSTIALETTEWKKIYEFLKLGNRIVNHDVILMKQRSALN
jgi:imidazoleglycerol-phosphate dehydratase/histidinol-phosphatase